MKPTASQIDAAAKELEKLKVRHRQLQRRLARCSDAVELRTIRAGLASTLQLRDQIARLAKLTA